MKQTIDDYPLLYQLFLKIQHYDRHLGHRALGVKEFYTLIEALNSGVGLSDEKHFRKIVHLLWRKPHHDKTLFDHMLDISLSMIYEKSGKVEEDNSPQAPPSTNLSGTNRRNEGQPNTSTTTPASDTTGQERTDTDQKSSTAIEEDSLIISFDKASPDKGKDSLQLDIDELSEEINQYHFILKGNYFELGSRQLQQGVRVMRRRDTDKTQKVVDLEATIQKVSRQGYLENLVYSFGEKWTTDLLILVDNGESMIAFEPFTDELISVVDADYDINETVYFFRGIPDQSLFVDRLHRQEISVDELAEAPSQPVLIVSDAGAATGKLDEYRVEDTVDFLARIRKHRVAWLNPMPRDRWRKTSAEYISLYSNMFFLDPTELINVVKLFKAKIKSNTLLDRYVQEQYWE